MRDFGLPWLFTNVQRRLHRLSAEDAPSTERVQECQAAFDLDVDSKLFLGMEMWVECIRPVVTLSPLLALIGDNV